MPFEVRVVDEGPVFSGGEPGACRFTEDEWWNLLALAHECGFDPAGEYVQVVYPPEGETHELDNRLVAGLYIGVSAILHRDTLPFATTWESDDGRFHFRWADTPGYPQDRGPENDLYSRTNSDFDLDEAEIRELLKCLSNDRVLVERTREAKTS